jgi:hypothetical protein
LTNERFERGCVRQQIDCEPPLPRHLA